MELQEHRRVAVLIALESMTITLRDNILNPKKRDNLVGVEEPKTQPFTTSLGVYFMFGTDCTTLIKMTSKPEERLFFRDFRKKKKQGILNADKKNKATSYNMMHSVTIHYPTKKLQLNIFVLLSVVQT